MTDTMVREIRGARWGLPPRGGCRSCAPRPRAAKAWPSWPSESASTVPTSRPRAHWRSGARNLRNEVLELAAARMRRAGGGRRRRRRDRLLERVAARPSQRRDRDAGAPRCRALGGLRVDGAGGRTIGRVAGIHVDADDGEPRWAVIRLGPVAGCTAVPFEHVAEGAGRLWAGYERGSARRLASRPTRRSPPTTSSSSAPTGEFATARAARPRSRTATPT